MPPEKVMLICLVLVAIQVFVSFCGFAVAYVVFRKRPKGDILRIASLIVFLEMWLLGGVGLHSGLGMADPEGRAVSPIITQCQLLAALLLLVLGLLRMARKSRLPSTGS